MIFSFFLIFFIFFLLFAFQTHRLSLIYIYQTRERTTRYQFRMMLSVLKKIKDTTYERLGLRFNNDKDIVQFKKDMKECQDKLLYELLKTFPMLCFLID